jgi:Alcohol dehydrogenase GroES-like domain
LGTIGLDNEVDRQTVGGPRLGRPDDGHQCSSGSNKACGPLPDVAANDIENQIDAADVFHRVILKVDELLRSEVEHRLTVGGASGADHVGAGLTCELGYHRTVKLLERPEPQAAINDVVVQVYASGFVPTELTWPSTWTDRLDSDRTPSIPGHELAGVVTALGYGTAGLSVGQRVFGLADWYRDGTLAEYVAIEARNLAPLPGDVDFTVGASLPISGLTAWQGLFEHGHLQAGQSVLVHGGAGAVASRPFPPPGPLPRLPSW